MTHTFASVGKEPLAKETRNSAWRVPTDLGTYISETWLYLCSFPPLIIFALFSLST